LPGTSAEDPAGRDGPLNCRVADFAAGLSRKSPARARTPEPTPAAAREAMYRARVPSLPARRPSCAGCALSSAAAMSEPTQPAPLGPDPRDGIWAEVAYSLGPEDSATFVAKIPRDFVTEILQRPDDEFIRFNFVRWIDEEDGEPYGKEEDREVGTDHYLYLRKSTVFCIEPLRGEFVAKWDATLPDYP
jgi:hypothetical protein